MTRFYLDQRGGEVIVTKRYPVLPPPVWYRTREHAQAMAARLNGDGGGDPEDVAVEEISAGGTE